MHNPTAMSRRARLAVLCALSALTSTATAQTRVDLSSWQTPLKSQGARGTCITFSSVAALEARYKRNGVTLDLSEEFVNYIGKMMWLHPYWTDIVNADTPENQMGWTSGGGGVGHAHNFTYWMKIPRESVWPYRSTEYSVPYPWGHAHWNSQRNINSWNLDPANLPRSVLNQSEYFSATGVVDMPGAQSRDTALIESKLQQGFEVIWDFSTCAVSGAIWRPAAPDGGAHSMLIIGYDRTSSNPANHYFIVKNSWGPTTNPGGYTWISYDFVRQLGNNACHLTGAKPAEPWPNLRYLGRRNMSFDGHRGTLDIYHVPGASTEVWRAAYGVTRSDMRIGTFYNSAGVAHRVNGHMIGDTLWFWIKSNTPNMPPNETRESPLLGQSFQYRIVDGDGDELAGLHWDNAGNTPNPAIGGYARRPSTMFGTNGYLAPVFNNALGWVPAQWLGLWRLRYLNRDDEVLVEARDDSQLTATERLTWAGLRCWVHTVGGPWQLVYAKTDLAQGRELLLTADTGVGEVATQVWMQAWQRGVAGGRGTSPASLLYHGAYMVRLGEYQRGSFSSVGTGCFGVTLAGSTASGFPVLGTPVRYTLSGPNPTVLANRPAAFSLGVSNTTWNGLALPFNMAPMGASNCLIRGSQEIVITGTTNASGQFSDSFTLTVPSLIGVPLYAQGYVAGLTGVNPAGLVASNAVTTRWSAAR